MVVLEGGARVELGAWSLRSLCFPEVREVLDGLQDVIWREMGTLIQ